jgi:hypothetical protein
MNPPTWAPEASILTTRPPIDIHIEFELGKAVLEVVNLQTLRISLSAIVPPKFHIHLSVICSSLVATAIQLTPQQVLKNTKYTGKLLPFFCETYSRYYHRYSVVGKRKTVFQGSDVTPVLRMCWCTSDG